MSESTEVKKPKRPLPKSRQLVNAQTAQIYKEAFEAKARGEKIGWSTAIFPQEICETLGVPVLYPENNAASISAKHLEEELIQYSEGPLRYPMNICSYARLNIGLAHKIQDPNYDKADPLMPLPDFLLLANNSCTQLMKWYECLARDLNIPIFFVDCLYNYDNEPVAAHKIEYIKSQIEDLTVKIAEFTGKKFDQDKFLEVQKRSQINSQLFDDIVKLNMRKPAPVNGFDFFNYMSCMVLARGKESTTEIFEELQKEILEHIANGTTTFPGEEKYRVHWEGIACWPNLGHNLKTLRNYNVNAVINGYVTAWNVAYKPGDLYDMARAYAWSSTNSFSTENIMHRRADTIENYDCDGMLCHVNRSCKMMTFHIYVGKGIVEERTGVSIANFDGDQSDNRVYSEAQFETRVQGLVEIMQQNKEAKNG